MTLRWACQTADGPGREIWTIACVVTFRPTLGCLPTLNYRNWVALKQARWWVYLALETALTDKRYIWIWRSTTMQPSAHDRCTCIGSFRQISIYKLLTSVFANKSCAQQLHETDKFVISILDWPPRGHTVLFYSWSCAGNLTQNGSKYVHWRKEMPLHVWTTSDHY